MRTAICGGCRMPLGPEAVQVDARGQRWLEPHTKADCAVVLAARAARVDLAMTKADMAAVHDDMRWKDFTGKGTRRP